MTDESSKPKKPNFPILRGDSVGEDGEFSGRIVLVQSPDELKGEWASDQIIVLHHSLEAHFLEHPGDLDDLFSKASAVLSETGESVGEFAAQAYIRSVIALVKVHDACFVLEDDMHVRIVAHENVGEVFFID
jgi:phosphohistidine swiveling domain-containing protein